MVAYSRHSLLIVCHLPVSTKERIGRNEGASSVTRIHCLLIGEIPLHVIAQVREAIADGHATFKILTTNIRPTDRLPTVEQRRLVGMGHLAGVMAQAAQHGGMMLTMHEVIFLISIESTVVRTVYCSIHIWTQFSTIHPNFIKTTR